MTWLLSLSKDDRLIEMEAIIADLLDNFKFSIPEDNPDIIRIPSQIMCPMVKGKESEGVWMPLNVISV